MKIVDKREHTNWVPAVEILESIIPHMKPDQFHGIRQIVLLDTDYHYRQGGVRAAGRYCAIKRSNKADIELYFDGYNDLPDIAKTNRMYLTYLLTHILMHEVYHHIVRGQRRVRRPKQKTEEEKANQWGERAVGGIFKKLYPREQYEAEWNEIQEAIRKHKEEKAQSGSRD